MAFPGLGFSEAARDGQVRISTGPGEGRGPQASILGVERDRRGSRVVEVQNSEKNTNQNVAAAFKMLGESVCVWRVSVKGDISS